MMKVIVLGAYGYTGSLVCKELMSSRIEFAIAGRNKEKLLRFKEELACNILTEVIDLTNEEEVKNLVENYNVFVNCVGPFTETATYLLKYISIFGKSYFDITGELNFVQNSRDRYHEIAQQNGATIVHSCAFESVLSNLLGSEMMEGKSDVQSINVFYDLGKSKPSPGTRLTMKLSKFRQPYFIIDGSRKYTTDIDVKPMDGNGFLGKSAIPYPLPEVCFFDWQTEVPNIGTYLLIDNADSKYYGAPMITSKQDKEKLINKYNTGVRQGPNEYQRMAQSFTISIVLENGRGEEKKLEINGKDMYLLTAKIISYFVQQCLEEIKRNYGVLTPYQFLDDPNVFFKHMSLNINRD